MAKETVSTAAKESNTLNDKFPTYDQLYRARCILLWLGYTAIDNPSSANSDTIYGLSLILNHAANLINPDQAEASHE